MSVSNSTLSRSSLEDTARKICETRGGKWSGTKGMACCPAHDDRTPSLGVTLGRKAILFHCFAGCDQQSVLAALAREGFEAPACRFPLRSDPLFPSRIDPGDGMSRRAGFGSSW
jgi:putative DNA primase/helicase